MTPGCSEPRAESREVAALLAELSKRAATTDPFELVRDWRAIERRVFACLRALERELPGSARDLADIERLRNLAWEVGVSIELHAVHSRALSTLAEQLGRRGLAAGASRPVKRLSEPAFAESGD